MAPGNNPFSAISSDIFKYVRIHPNFTRQPVWCEKIFLCCFFFESREKRLHKQAYSSLSPSPPHPPCPSLLKRCRIWIHEIWTPWAARQNPAKILLTSFGGTNGRGVGVDVCAVCLETITAIAVSPTRMKRFYSLQPDRQTNSNIAESAFLHAKSHCPDHACDQVLRLCSWTDLGTLSGKSPQITRAALR